MKNLRVRWRFGGFGESEKAGNENLGQEGNEITTRLLINLTKKTCDGWPKQSQQPL